MRRTWLLSLLERLVRSLSAVSGGLIHESVEVLLPRFVRRSHHKVTRRLRRSEPG